MEKIKYLIIKNNFFSQFLLVGIILLAFSPSFFAGHPRADQVWYLNQVSIFDTFNGLLSNAPSWNRSFSAGDFILYRPILYIQLNLFYFFFRHNYFLWQLASIVLHSLVALTIYSLFLKTSISKTIYPFLIASLFAVGFSNCELTLWNHISGYITFSFFGLFSLLSILNYYENAKLPWLILSMISCFLSALTYELGVVLLFIYLIHIISNDDKFRISHKKKYIIFGFVFLIALYFYLNISDLAFRNQLNVLPSGNNFGNSFTEQINNVFELVLISFTQTLYWIFSIFIPAAIKFEARDRAALVGINTQGILFYINCISLVILIISILPFWKNIFSGITKRTTPIMATLFLYSFIISFGRSGPNGLIQANLANTYYSYISILIFFAVLAISLYSPNYNRLGTNKDYENLRRSSLTSYSLISIIALNMIYTFELGLGFLKLAKSRLRVLDNTNEWVKNNKRLSTSDRKYFYLDVDCDGNEVRNEFGAHHAAKKYKKYWPETVTLSDAIHPEFSYRINERRLNLNESDKENLTCEK